MLQEAPPKPSKRVVIAYLDADDFQFIDRQLRVIAPGRKLGFPKSKIIEGFLKSIVIALHRPNHYSVGEMVLHMCKAATKPEDTEGQELIDNLFR